MQNSASNILIEILAPTPEIAKPILTLEKKTEGSLAAPLAAVPTLVKGLKRLDHQARDSQDRKAARIRSRRGLRVSVSKSALDRIGNRDPVGAVPCRLVVGNRKVAC
jgi:hypothetical protein